MADTKLSALTADTSPTKDDLIYTVNAPGGTPGSRRATIENLLKVINDLTADSTPDATADYVVTYDASATAAKKVLLSSIAVAYPCNGRLTGTSGTAVTTSGVSNITTLYFTPFNGDKIALYSGSAWATLTFTETSIALGTMTSGICYDVFAYNSSGTLALEKLAWTSSTARATALTLQNGVYVKSGDATRRYLGTFYTTSTTQTQDTNTQRFLYNYYNRAERSLEKTDTTSHTYTTGSWRYWNNDSTQKVEFVLGIADQNPFVYINTRQDANSGETSIVGFGVDTASTNTTGSNPVNAGPSATVNIGGIGAARAGVSGAYPAVGYHYISAVEFGAASSADYVAMILTTIIQG